MKYHPHPILKATEKVAVERSLNGCGTEILLTGVPGSGKTQFAYYLARQTNAKLFRYDCNAESNRSLMYEVDVQGVITRTAAFLQGALWQAFEASWKKKVILILDEVDKTHTDFDAYLLRVLEEKSFVAPDGSIVTGKPENITFILTSNGRRMLRTETLRRLYRVNVPYPSISVQRQIVLEQSVAGAREALAACMVKIAETLRAKLGYEVAPSPKEVTDACDMAIWLQAESREIFAEMLAGKLLKEGGVAAINKAILYNWVDAIKTDAAK